MTHRKTVSPLWHAAASEQVRGHVAAWLAAQAQSEDTLGFCWPWQGEVDLRPVLMAWQQNHPLTRLVLPVAHAPDAPLVFHEWAADVAMTRDHFGIPAPLNTPARPPSVLFIPGLAFDPQGFRLGYGKGCFDRTLQTRGVLLRHVLGLCFEAGRLERVCPEAHDRPVDGFFTEAGFWPCSPE